MVKISVQSEHFSVHVLKVSHSKFLLFKPIFRHMDPESGSGFRIRIRIPNKIECGSNRLRIRIRNTDLQVVLWGPDPGLIPGSGTPRLLDTEGNSFGSIP